MSDSKYEELSSGVVEILYVDYSPEYDPILGKTVAKSDVRGMTDEQRATEIAEMLALLGTHIVPVTVEWVAQGERI